MIRQKYTILFGGTKNVGDFCIFQSIRLKKVKKLRNNDFILMLFENLENYLNQINKTHVL